MYKSSNFMPISTIFTALFYPYIARERTAQNLISSVRSERSALCLKERHRSQNEGSLKSDWAISKSDMPSSWYGTVRTRTSKHSAVRWCWFIGSKVTDCTINMRWKRLYEHTVGWNIWFGATLCSRRCRRKRWHYKMVNAPSAQYLPCLYINCLL